MLIQIHILQNYAPANLNRDDTGSPKDAMFGGFRRGRISSQCIKRSIRRSPVFVQAFEMDGLLGSRTRLLPKMVQKELEAMGIDDTAVQAIVGQIPQIGHKSRASDDEGKSKEGTPVELATRQLIFIGRNEVHPLAEKLVDLYKAAGPDKWVKIELEKELGASLPRSVDIALFGRMTTSVAFEDIQAAAQVAHAISTNAVTQEFDYFTAVDDLSGETGAGMIGDIEFNSSTYYKYLNVHWEGLLENLGGDTAIANQAVVALLEAAATAQPSGKQNSFAAFNLPDWILVEISEKNLPISYANAFLTPVRATGDQSLLDISVKKLGDYMERLQKAYGLDLGRASLSTSETSLPGVKPCASLAELKDWLADNLPE